MVGLRQRAWDAAATVVDPEIPVLTIADLGVLRDVVVTGDAVEVAITPTYSGCPAMAMIALDVETALARAGIANARVITVLSPAWTTDWMTPQAHAQLRDYGIAPPCSVQATDASHTLRFVRTLAPVSVACPRCDSSQTTEVSHFGSTACKALFKCLACLEPFDHFKPH